MRHLIIIVLIFSQSFPLTVYAANIPNSSQSVTLNKLGIWKTEQEAAYPELVRRIQTWAENIDSINVQVVRGNHALSKSDLAIDKLRSELGEASEKLQVQLFKGGDKLGNKKLVDTMVQIRRKASGRAELGPEIQKSLVVEAAYNWNEGNISQARIIAERAIKIHPEGQINSFDNWDSSVLGHFNVDAFDTFLSEVKSKQTRSCAIRTDISPSSSQVRVNGFSVSNPKEFVLASGSSHHLEITALGFEPKKEMISCRGLETKRMKWNLRQIQGASLVTKNESIQPRDFKSMLLIEPKEDRFRLFLYTPGTAIDEMPLKHPIKLAELGGAVENREIPIATDAAINLFEKHRLLAMNLQVANFEKEDPFSSLKPEVRGESKGKNWIESPVFWGIVGGVLLGGAISYFATQNKGTSTTTSDWN